MRAEAGFTLVEVLVAFVVTGLIAAALLPALHVARTREARAVGRIDAMRFAEGELQRLSLAPRTAAATSAGATGPWRWEATLAMTPLARGERTPVRLRRATIAVRGEPLGDAPLILSLDHLVDARER